MLDFLRAQTDTRYLARPKLLTLNNETAEISVVKDEIVGINETTTFNSTGMPATTREYVRASDLNLTQEGVGIFLRVTPQINPETKEVTMVINPKSSTTTQSAISANHADPELRSTKSVVKVKNGETIILGGLIHKDKSIITRKLPFFGDMPFIGILFRHKNQEKDRERELLIFITPRVVKEKDLRIAKVQKSVLPEVDREPVLEISRQEMITEFLNELDRKKK
jgi:type II secretory pathway component GspD/PulD (secretin)